MRASPTNPIVGRPGTEVDVVKGPHDIHEKQVRVGGEQTPIGEGEAATTDEVPLIGYDAELPERLPPGGAVLICWSDKVMPRIRFNTWRLTVGARRPRPWRRWRSRVGVSRGAILGRASGADRPAAGAASF